MLVPPCVVGPPCGLVPPRTGAIEAPSDPATKSRRCIVPPLQCPAGPSLLRWPRKSTSPTDPTILWPPEATATTLKDGRTSWRAGIAGRNRWLRTDFHRWGERRASRRDRGAHIAESSPMSALDHHVGLLPF